MVLGKLSFTTYYKCLIPFNCVVLGKLSFPTYYQCCTEFSKTQQSRDVLYVAGPARIKGCPFAQRRASWCVTLPSRASRQKMAGVPQIPGGLRCLPFHHINSASVLGLLFSHCPSEYEPTSSWSLPSSDEIARPVGRPRPHVGRMASSICLPTHRSPTYFPWRRLDVLQPQGFRS